MTTEIHLHDAASPIQPSVPDTEVLTPSSKAESHVITSRLGKYALGAAAVVACSLPVIGAGIEAATYGPAAHVPMKIAGATVVAEVKPGSSVDSFQALDTTFTGHSRHQIGHKDFGVAVTFDFSQLDGTGIKTFKQAFEQLSDTKAQRREISDAIKANTTRNFLAGAGSAFAIEVATAAYVYRRRKYYADKSTDEAQLIRADRKRLRQVGYTVLAGSAIALTAVPLIQYGSPNHAQTVVADPNLDGTPFKGMALRGVFQQPIDVLMPNVAPLLHDKSAYIKNANQNIDDAISAAYPEGVPENSDTYTVVLADDFQGIDVTTGALGKIAQRYHANAILVAGDTMETGAEFETNVVDGLSYIHKKYKVPIAIATGRHDNYQTLRTMAKDRDFVMANEQVQEVGGIRVYGANEATQDLPGFPAKLLNPGVSDETKVAQAIKTLCSQPANKPVLFFAHDSKQFGAPIAQSECSPLVATGRHITPHLPVNYDGRTTWNMISSAGGHTPDGFSVLGLPQSEVSFQVITLSKNTYQQVSSQVITLSPDVTATATLEPVIHTEQLPVENGQPVLPAKKSTGAQTASKRIATTKQAR